MRTRSATVIARTALALLASAALSGCGKSSKLPVNNDEVVFTSATDCAASGKVKPEQCTQAIEAAMKVHLATSPVYKNLDLCEAKEGKEHCERMDERTYRPRLSAVVLPVAAAIEAETSGKLKGATPLYPTLAREMGFRTLDKRVLLYDGDMLSFSPQAHAAAELNASTGKKKGGGGKLF